MKFIFAMAARERPSRRMTAAAALAQLQRLSDDESENSAGPLSSDEEQVGEEQVHVHVESSEDAS